jgi:hypothetical protein
MQCKATRPFKHLLGLGLAVGTLIYGMPSGAAPLRLESPMAPLLQATPEIPLETLKAKLAQGPLSGFIHAANRQTNTYVLTVRDAATPGSFRNIALIADTDAIWQQLQSVNRFDAVTVSGEFLTRYYPQAHLLVKSLTVTEPWSPKAPDSPGAKIETPPVDPSQELNESDELVGLVHALTGDGHVLMFDYKNTVIPVVVPDPALTRSLWRGDKVWLKLAQMPTPQQPVHWMLESFGKAEKQKGLAPPVKVLDAIRTLNGQTTTVSGPLTYYPAGPVFPQGAWAVESRDDQGLARYFVLSATDTVGLNRKLEGAWKQNCNEVMQGRHKLVNGSLNVEALGVVAIRQPNQPAPVLKLAGLDALKVTRQGESLCQLR